MQKARKLVNYSKLSPEINSLLSARYPDGFSKNDVSRVTLNGSSDLYVITLETDDCTYLVKVDPFKKLKKKSKGGTVDDHFTMSMTYDDSEGLDDYFTGEYDTTEEEL